MLRPEVLERSFTGINHDTKDGSGDAECLNGSEKPSSTPIMVFVTLSVPGKTEEHIEI